MTDLLLKPEDTGEFETCVGEATQRLRPDIPTNAFPLVVRSAFGEKVATREPTTIGLVDQPHASEPAAVLGLIGSCRRIDTSDPDEFEIATVPPEPMPVPTPQPDPKVDELWEEAEAPPYVGRHRKRTLVERLMRPLAIAWHRIGRAL